MWMERASAGALEICRSSEQVRSCLSRGVIAAIMHMEGAESIGPDLDALYVWHAAGLRSLGPVWSRPTVFGHGVPFQFPGSPDTGPGLTAEGKALIAKCNDLKIIVDLSHLNEKGFDDVATISSAPMVATHSNVHAITPSTRNLTDRQLAIIAETKGIVGLNYAVSFLREDGLRDPNLSWDEILNHLDHLLKYLGEDGVGLGSDFDGAAVPTKIGDVTGVGALQAAMIAHGYGKELVQKISSGNWLSFLDRSL
jgi:membrane dipeptidase